MQALQKGYVVDQITTEYYLLHYLFKLYYGYIIFLYQHITSYNNGQ